MMKEKRIVKTFTFAFKCYSSVYLGRPGDLQYFKIIESPC